MNHIIVAHDLREKKNPKVKMRIQMMSSFACERPAGATRALSTSTLEINTHGKAPQIQTDGQLIHR